EVGGPHGRAIFEAAVACGFHPCLRGGGPSAVGRDLARIAGLAEAVRALSVVKALGGCSSRALVQLPFHGSPGARLYSADLPSRSPWWGRAVRSFGAGALPGGLLAHPRHPGRSTKVAAEVAAGDDVRASGGQAAVRCLGKARC
ncbi:unnamed protein product, partial [Symbiodinium pilosum]